MSPWRDFLCEEAVSFPQSVSFQDLGDPPSGDPFELNATDPLVAPPAGVTAYTPDQIHLQLAGGAMPFRVSTCMCHSMQHTGMLSAGRELVCCCAEGSPTSGSFWLTWSTGFYSFYQNQESPSYPTSTIYAPQTPDPASVSSVVGLLRVLQQQHDCKTLCSTGLRAP